MHMDRSEVRTFAGALIMTGVSFLLALCFEYLLFDKPLGIGFPLFILLILAGGVLLGGKRSFDTQIFQALVPLLFFSWMVFVRASELLTALNVMASILLLLLLGDLLTGKKLRAYVLRSYATILVLPLRFIPPLGRTVTDILSMRGVNRHSEVVSQVLKGILMAIPVLILFALLFSLADSVFQQYASKLLTFDISEEVIGLILRTIIVSCFFTGAFSYFLTPKEHAVIEPAKKQFSVGVIAASIFLGAINILFLLFILIQLVYLFGGAENITLQGFTYAQYARKGFFELIAVAVFSFLLLWKTEHSLTRKENLHHSVAFKVLSGILTAQIFVIMISAFKRLSLYEAAYGFTTLRLYSHAFILLLFVLFLILLYKIYLDARENTFAHRIFFAVIGFLVCMNLLNPDAFIARKNIEHFAEDPSKLDTYYLSNLSADVLPESIDVILASDKAGVAYGRLYELFNQADDPWQSTNIARLKARNLLTRKMQSEQQ